jgi:sorting nexin-25
MSWLQRQSGYHETGPKSGLALRDVLGNPSSLSYFMEFMDRRNRSLLVQFWLTVESFKNPLESVESGSSGDEDDPIQDPSNWTTVKEDISMIHDLYFSSPTPHPALASISKKHVDIIRSFARNELAPSTFTQRRVRRSVMLAQRQVERDMENDFGDFERSELWFRAISDTDFGSRKPQPDASSIPIDSRPTAGLSTRPVPQGPAPQLVPRSESSSLLFERTAGSKSNRSSSSLSSSVLPAASSSRHAPSHIEALMFPTLEKSSESSRAPLFDDPNDETHLTDKAQLQRMEAIQAALTDIIALDRQNIENPRSTQEANDTGTRHFLFPSTRMTENTKRTAVFDEDNEDDGDDERLEDTSGDGHGSFQLAAPGDLQLSYEIARLGDKVANLQSQDLILDTLIKKAELTGDTQELRLLRKSKSSMNRELRQLKFQKLQYEQQEAANRLLSDRTKVAIVNSTVGEEEGKSVVRYLIEVQQLASDGSFSSGWVVARRYNEFLSLHNKLRERYGLVRNLDFPGKRLVAALSGSFLDTRKAALEKYLQVG